MNAAIQTSILEAALQTLDIEIEVLRSLRTGIDDTFCRVVETIHASPGRVIVTGIGKSAIVAQKIVATLNSTGTPSMFMHAADAIHGDLGMIQSGDIVLCLSKSGNSAEIKVLVPLVRQMGNLIVGMTAHRESWLGQQASFVLYTPVSKEADPNNLAPTASTTAQMVMGDALAVSLLALRGFRPSDFALIHPGGTLGKQMYLRVRDLCIHNARPSVQTDTPIHETILEMTSKRLGCAIVCTPRGQLAGIITDGDLRRMLERHGLEGIASLHAADVMTADPKSIEAGELAVQALRLMRENSITQLVVVDQGQYAGVVHLHDLIREGLV